MGAKFPYPMNPLEVIPPSAQGTTPALGLGLDAGGTQTRWALVNRSGTLMTEGHIAGFGATQLGTPQGRELLQQALHDLVVALQPHTQGLSLGVYAGVTGLGDPEAEQALRKLIVESLGVLGVHVTLKPDMELAYRAAFKPGEGYLIYAGTGSIAAFIDEYGQTHRAGGRGGILGDEGGGYWIATQALAAIWRQEDLRPGAWHASAMARRIFEALGGSDWAATRRLVYGVDRGAIGQLALQVAASAEDDTAAHALLLRAGAELARLANTMLQRFGARPMLATGRALMLHPLIEQGLRHGLPLAADLRVNSELSPQREAARLALRLTDDSIPQDNLEPAP